MLIESKKLKLEEAVNNYQASLKYVGSLGEGIIKVFALLQFIITFIQTELIDENGDLVQVKWYSFIFNSKLREFTIKVIRETIEIINGAN